jgi:hypothetical protein
VDQPPGKKRQAAKTFVTLKKPAPLNRVQYAPGAKRIAIKNTATKKPARENTEREKHATERLAIGTTAIEKLGPG